MIDDLDKKINELVSNSHLKTLVKKDLITFYWTRKNSDLLLNLLNTFTKQNDIVFDPFMGVASAGIAALLHERKFIGADTEKEYIQLAESRIRDLRKGKLKYRPHDKPVYDHKLSPLSKIDV